MRESYNCNSLHPPHPILTPHTRSLLKTVVIVIGLSISVIGFSRDAETLVIEPIERMIKLVKALAENPLASLYREKDGGDEGFETTLLETTLEKISSLLQVGFGVAGAQIIQSNMSSGGDLDVMIPGKKITAVFGFGIMEEVRHCEDEAQRRAKRRAGRLKLRAPPLKNIVN